MMCRKMLILISVFAAYLFLSACRSAPVQNDGDYEYEVIPFFEVDSNYYEVTGVVQPQNVIVERTGLVEMPYRDLGMDSENSSEILIVRLLLTEPVGPVQDAPSIISEGNTVVMKVYGSPANGLAVGDETTFKCRIQLEAVGAVAPLEEFDHSVALVEELENCRLLTPVVNGAAE